MSGLPHSTIKLHDYSKDEPAVTRRQANAGHMCSICSVARSNPLSKPVKKLQTPSPNQLRSTSKTLQVCSKCLSSIHWGKPHHCTKEMKLRNLVRFAGNDTDDLLTSSLRIKKIPKKRNSFEELKRKTNKS